MGRLDVDNMLEEMDAGMLVEWMGYSWLEPWGEERADLRAGVICTHVERLAVGRKSRSRPQDFVMKFGPREVQSADQIRQALERVFPR